MVYELNGEMFEDEVAFLEAARREYVHGDKQLVLDTLDVYGFDENDLRLNELRTD